MGALGIDDTLLSIIVCPQCHGALQADEAAVELVCQGECGLAYPVRMASRCSWWTRPSVGVEAVP